MPHHQCVFSSSAPPTGHIIIKIKIMPTLRSKRKRGNQNDDESASAAAAVSGNGTSGMDNDVAGEAEGVVVEAEAR